jgi:galactose mutarotase-like enzyme
MTLSTTRINAEGFDAIHVNTGVIELTLIPELGGKVSSLFDTRNQREWLWRHPRYKYKRVPHGSSYIESADTGGWDECFPSVSQCEYPSEPWSGAAIQDHGELWNQSAELKTAELSDGVEIQTRWQGVALPYTFARIITLTANSSLIHVNYEVTNKSDEPIHYVWCIHPLLAIEPDMELHLPTSARFNIGGSIPLELVSPQQTLTYPFTASSLNFPALPQPSAACAIKIWSNPLESDSGWASLHASDGQFHMRWDASLLPQVAAWMNFGAWSADGGSPYFNLGLEPCIGAQDSLADAVNQFNLFEVLSPHRSKHWRLEIELTSQ